MTSLLQEPWMPVRRRDGSRIWIAPDQLADPDILAFDADRPDFNGALAQFAVGLLQTCTPVNSGTAWKALFTTPPDPATLREWFEPVSAVFTLDGDGPCFMQDFSLRASDTAPNDIAALLIETPGDNTIKNNSDHFIKRGRASALCPHCAASALLTLQINAPAGGQGHRTGLRGGGPLTTLVVGTPVDGRQSSLWQNLWLNVRERNAFLEQCGDASRSGVPFRFPWMADIATIQKDGGETAPAQVHPDHIFWAMPRRIRLDFDQTSTGTCDLCGRPSDRLISQYVTRNFGFNYKGAWNHPLSPYYETKEGWLPLHPQPGGFAYRHWLGWVLGQTTDKKKQRRANIVEHVFANRRRQTGGQLRLWAFGYDMDNMKARCWYESTLPLYGLVDCEADTIARVEDETGRWLASADLAAFYLRSAVRDAWFDGDARGDFSHVDASFWSGTEAAFYSQLRALIERARDDDESDMTAVREAWLAVLSHCVRNLFDEVFVGAGQVERQKPRRIAQAHQQLVASMRGPKIRQALGLVVPDAKPKSGKKGAKAAPIKEMI